MKQRKRSFDIFNLSFLDVISCGFGAVVLLVLISNHSDLSASANEKQSLALLNSVLNAEKVVGELRNKVQQETESLDAKQSLISSFQKSEADLNRALALAQNESKELHARRDGLELVQKSLKKASISQSSTNKRDEEVGDIPVDSDYVIFIVDTSGSMQEIWGRVTAEIDNVINIHPKVKGFQILNDMGTPIISAYRGMWIPDTPRRRANVLKLFRGWNSASNSSPIEGMEVALRDYAKPGKSVSIYVFGDDYTGSSYDSVINTLDNLNRNKTTGKLLAKIHAVGFLSNYSTNRFPILMREITRRNGGTFLAIPK